MIKPIVPKNGKPAEKPQPRPLTRQQQDRLTSEILRRHGLE
jgi:hypothetical protein